MYEAWGKWVQITAEEHLCRNLGVDGLGSILKIPVRPRLKCPERLIEKAYRPGKSYTDPYTDITDKVGMRFVLQTTTEVRQVGELFSSFSFWNISKDKDFEEEQAKNPAQFAYQSMHFVVRSKEPINFEGISVPAGLPCEIQVRTLLQHALAELTHDITYKPKTMNASPEVQRTCARAIALVEVVDEMFVRVIKSVHEASKPLDDVMSRLKDIYSDCINELPHEGILNTYLIDAYYEHLTTCTEQNLREFLSKKSFIIDNIRSRRETNELFCQPAILLIYYLAKTQPYVTRANWPFTPEELVPIGTDLGIPFLRD